jgi:hypothetical protein
MRRSLSSRSTMLLASGMSHSVSWVSSSLHGLLRVLDAHTAPGPHCLKFSWLSSSSHLTVPAAEAPIEHPQLLVRDGEALLALELRGRWASSTCCSRECRASCSLHTMNVPKAVILIRGSPKSINAVHSPQHPGIGHLTGTHVRSSGDATRIRQLMLSTNKALV